MKTLLIAVSLFAAVTLAYAQSTTITPEIDSSSTWNIAVFHAQDDNFVFAQECNGDWWQAYAGKSIAPTTWSQFSIGIGAESNGFRYGGSASVFEGKGSATILFEGGASGPWHRLIAKYAVTPELTLGVTDRSFYGHGVRVEVKTGSSSKLIGEYYEGGTSTLAYSHTF